jgi:hypothetical protein
MPGVILSPLFYTFLQENNLTVLRDLILDHLHMYYAIIISAKLVEGFLQDIQFDEHVVSHDPTFSIFLSHIYLTPHLPPQ